MNTSLFEIFKIGIGPPSSHTVGPMRAACDFAAELGSKMLLPDIRRVRIDLYGSLALTGRGHSTDHAVILGLCGGNPERIDPASIEPQLAAIREHHALRLRGTYPVPFNQTTDLLFHKDEALARHSNGMRFSVFGEDGATLAEAVFYSIGGGFILREGEETTPGTVVTLPHPFGSAAELLELAERRGMAIWQIVFENERASRGENEIREYVDPRTAWR